MLRNDDNDDDNNDNQGKDVGERRATSCRRSFGFIPGKPLQSSGVSLITATRRLDEDDGAAGGIYRAPDNKNKCRFFVFFCSFFWTKHSANCVFPSLTHLCHTNTDAQRNKSRCHTAATDTLGSEGGATDRKSASDRPGMSGGSPDAAPRLLVNKPRSAC